MGYFGGEVEVWLFQLNAKILLHAACSKRFGLQTMAKSLLFHNHNSPVSWCGLNGFHWWGGDFPRWVVWEWRFSNWLQEMNIINFAFLHLHWKWHFNIRAALSPKALSRLPKPFSTQPNNFHFSHLGPSLSLSVSLSLVFFLSLLAARKNFQLLCAIAATWLNFHRRQAYS